MIEVPRTHARMTLNYNESTGWRDGIDQRRIGIEFTVVLYCQQSLVAATVKLKARLSM